MTPMATMERTEPSVTPRLLSLKQARAYLGGKHPALIGARPIGAGRGQLWDRKEIDIRLDERAGIESSFAPSKGGTPANDGAEDELDALAQRIAHAPRRP